MFAYVRVLHAEILRNSWCCRCLFPSILALKKQQFLFEPRKYHPDKNLEASKEEASRRFREVAEAYAALNQFLG